MSFLGWAEAFAVEWDWPLPPAPVPQRRVFDIADHRHWL